MSKSAQKPRLLDEHMKPLLEWLHPMIGDRQWVWFKHPRWGMYQNWVIGGPDFITLFGVVLVAFYQLFFIAGWNWAIGPICVLIGLCDCADGPYSRVYENSKTERGGFLDSFTDKGKHLWCFLPMAIVQVTFGVDFYVFGLSGTWLIVLLLYAAGLLINTRYRLRAIRKLGWAEGTKTTAASLPGKIKVWFEVFTIGLIGIYYANQQGISPTGMLISNAVAMVGVVLLVPYRLKLYGVPIWWPYTVMVAVLFVGTLPAPIVAELPWGLTEWIRPGFSIYIAQFVGIVGFAFFTVASAAAKLMQARKERTTSDPSSAPTAE